MNRLSTHLILLAGACMATLTSCEEEKVLDGPTGITLTISEAANVTSSSASFNVTVSLLGSVQVVERGVCYGLTDYPSVDGTKTSNGSGGDNFSAILTGLSGSTAYHARAYAIDAKNAVWYGNEVTFTTSAPRLVLTTLEATSISSSGAISGGIVTIGQLGASVSVAGVCWSTTPGPTTSDAKTQDIFSEGPFMSTLAGLSAGTTYFVRAYAIDDLGETSYANEITFATTGAGSQNSLDGTWIEDGQNDPLIINTIAGTGVYNAATFTPSPEYQVVLNNNLATVATPYIKNIVKTSNNTWTCSKFAFSFQGSGSSATITNVNYIPGVITLSNDGMSFTLVATVTNGLGYPASLVGTVLTSTWTRQ